MVHDPTETSRIGSVVDLELDLSTKAGSMTLDLVQGIKLQLVGCNRVDNLRCQDKL